MSSELKANKISPATSTDITLGDSGDTFTVPSGATLAVSGTITLPANSVDSDQYVDGSIDNVHLADDAVDSDELAAGSVDIAHLSATGTAGSGNFLRGDNSWTAASQFANWSQSSGHLTPDNATYGIHLGVATATAANLLSDYEEGSWTPGLTWSSGGTSGITYTTQLGLYVKIGKLVHASFHLVTSNNGTGSGSASMTGLPFTVSNTSNAAYGSSLVTNYRNAFSADHYPGGYAVKNGTTIQMVNLDPDDQGTSVLSESDWMNASNLYGSITYRSAA